MTSEFIHVDGLDPKARGREAGNGEERGCGNGEWEWSANNLWGDGSHAPDQVAKGLEKTIEDLGLEYLDLYLMHWPVTQSPSGNELGYIDVGLPRSPCPLKHPSCVHKTLTNASLDLAGHDQAPPHRPRPPHRRLQLLPHANGIPNRPLRRQALRTSNGTAPLPPANGMGAMAPSARHPRHSIFAAWEHESHVWGSGKG